MPKTFGGRNIAAEIAVKFSDGIFDGICGRTIGESLSIQAIRWLVDHRVGVRSRIILAICLSLSKEWDSSKEDASPIVNEV